MELSEFINVIRKWILLILPVVLLVTGYYYISGTRGETAYRAQAYVVIGLSGLTSPGGGDYVASNAPKIGTTLLELVTTEPIMQKTLEITGLDWSQAALSSKIKMELPKDTSVMKIAVTDKDPALAKRVVDAVADSIVLYVRDINEANYESKKKAIEDDLVDVDKEISNVATSGTNDGGSRMRVLQQTQSSLLTEYNDLLNEKIRYGDVRVVQPASPYSSIGIQTSQRTVIAFIVSLVAAIGLAFVAEAISKALKESKSLAE